MDNEITADKRRDLKCLSLGNGDTWEKLKQLAKQRELSISGYVRFLVSKEYKKERRKELSQLG